jgi:hypothetical protein
MFHGDIKPDNIALYEEFSGGSNLILKMIDLGNSIDNF